MKKTASTLFVLTATLALWATVTKEECNSMFSQCLRYAQNTQQVNDCYIQRGICYQWAELE